MRFHDVLKEHLPVKTAPKKLPFIFSNPGSYNKDKSNRGGFEY
ncbi:hypothetical protein A943_11545 [Bacillus sp. CPSM8]|nr:hypothetical protein A943_11545 [Bacillus sp. CPSM8]